MTEISRAKLSRLIEGQIRSCMHDHPDYFNVPEKAVGSLTKRILGEIQQALNACESGDKLGTGEVGMDAHASPIDGGGLQKSAASVDGVEHLYPAPSIISQERIVKAGKAIWQAVERGESNVMVFADEALTADAPYHGAREKVLVEALERIAAHTEWNDYQQCDMFTEQSFMAQEVLETIKSLGKDV